MLNRRNFLKGAIGGAAVSGSILLLPRGALAAELPQGTIESASLDVLPGKLPLIKRSYRPPNFETPLSAFGNVITPNEQFFVRWHLANIPQISAETWRLRVGGDSVERPFELTLDQLKREFEPVELTAICQCAGNRRGLSDPHVAGVEWGYGAMGNARWKGVRLRELLLRAGIKSEAVEIVFDGADTGASDKTPDFVKSLPVWKALDENTLIAYEMNGEALPHWNGFPARLVVPGWVGTYWMKQLVSVSAVRQPEKGFWMSTAYRIPKGKFPIVDRFISQESEANTPITEMVVNSLITNVAPSQRLRAGRATTVEGLAWDGGYGIRTVDVSLDGGKNWQAATLGPDAGRFSFRPWHFPFKPPQRGSYVLMAKATNRVGATQTEELIFNPAGYHNNVMQRIPLEVA